MKGKKILLLLVLVTLVFCISTPGVYAKKTNMVLDKSGRLTVNGKPEFPVGIYVGFTAAYFANDVNKRAEYLASLDDLKNSPIHILVNYGDTTGTTDEMKKLLDEFVKRGLYDMFSVKDYYAELEFMSSGGPGSGKSDEEVTRSVVKAVKDHPAVLGWYIWDEAPRSGEIVSKHDRWIKEEGSSKPTFLVSCDSKAEKLEPFTTAADIIAVDPYPLPWNAVNMVSDWMDELTKANKTKHPQWMVPQAFGWYMYDSEVRDRGVRPTPKKILDKGRMPTPREMRAMTYLGLTHGADGLIYYYYNDIKTNDDGGVSWNALKSIAQEVKDLSPILLASDAKKDSIAGDNSTIHWKAKQKDGKTYLIAVNSSRDTQNITFTLPSVVKKVKLMKGTGVTYPWNNELLLTLDGYEAVTLEVLQ